MDGGWNGAFRRRRRHTEAWSDQQNLVHLLVFRPAGNGVGYDSGTDTGTRLSSADFARTWPVDLDGNGIVDLLQAANTGGSLALTRFYNSGPASDLISSITDGLQGQTAITYLPMSDASVYSAAASSYPQGPAMAYAYRQAPALAPFQRLAGGTMQLVAGWTAQSSASNPPYSYPHAMRYSGGAIDYTGFGWLGFQTRSETDLTTGRISTSVYSQKYPLIGSPISVTTSCIAVSGGDPKCPANTPATLVVSNKQYTSTQTATSSSPQKTPVWLSLPSTTRMDRYVYGTYDYSLGRSYTYDAYGNATLTTDLGYVDRSGNNTSTSDDVFTCASYDNRTSGTWLLGLQTGEKTSATSACTNFGSFDASKDFSLWTATWGTNGLRSAYNIYDSSNSAFLNTAYTYDRYGNLLTQVDPGNRTTTYTYETVFNTYRQSETTPPNAAGTRLTSQYGYDPRFGVPLATTDPNQLTRVRCVDGFGRLTATQVPVPNFVSMQADTNCVPSTVTGSSAASFRAASVVTSETRVNASDSNGNLYVEVQSLDAWSAGAARAWSWSRQYFDGLGRTVQTVMEGPAGGSGNISSCNVLDSTGSTLAQSVPSFTGGTSANCTMKQGDGRFWITSTYDALSRNTKTIRPAGSDGSQTSTTTITYGPGESQTVVSAAGDSYALTRSYQYSYFNGDRKTVAMVFNSDNNATTTYAYDRIGRLTSAVDPPTPSNPKGVANTITYDSLGRRGCVSNPDQAPNGGNARCWAYDGTTSFLKSATDATGRVTSFGYDALGRQTRRVDPDGTTTVYTWDDPSVAFGRFYMTGVSVTGPAPANTAQFSYAFTYDNQGNPSGRTVTLGSGPGPYRTQRQLDPQQRIAQVTWPDGTVLQNTYVHGFLTTSTVSGSPVATYSNFDAFGSPKSIAYGNGASTSITYAPTSEETGTVVTDAKNKTLLNRTFQWNHLGYVTAATDNLQDEVNLTQTYTYTNGRLTAAQAPGLYNGVTYGYDASGNLTKVNDTSYAYSAHRVVSGTSNGTTVLTASWDGNGNLTAKNAGDQWAYTYDTVNRLTAASRNSANVLQAPLYDDNDTRLIRRDADGVLSIYADPLYVVTESAGSYVLGTRYVPGPSGVVAALTTLLSGSDPAGGDGLPSAGSLYLHGDALGSTLVTTDAQGLLSSQIAYMPFGAPYASGSSGPDDYRLKFTGKELDEPTGLYYYGARYYDPQIGRFITPDTRLGSDLFAVDALNRYAYASNNPTSFVDPTGHSALDRVLGSLAGVFEIAAGVAIDVLSDGALAPVGDALIGAGTSGLTYSVMTGNNSFSWRSYGIQTGVGAAMGLVMGGFGGGAVGEEAGAVEASEVVGESELSTGTSQAAGEVISDAAGSEARTEAEAVESQAADGATGDDESAAQQRAGDEAAGDEESEQCSTSAASVAAGTPIETEDGFVAVENLTAGNRVWGFDAETGARGLFDVVGTTVSYSHTTIRIAFGERQLDAAPEEVLWVAGKGWTAARNLVAGDTLADASGRYTKVDGVEALEGRRAFHEFEVARAHTFYASNDSILAHNPSLARLFCMGRTPTKWSRTGRQVFQRMQKMGLTKGDWKSSQIWSQVSANEFRWVEIGETDMAHLEDASSWWNRLGYKYGPKAPEVREWMLDPENYELQYGNFNSKLGAAAQHYKPPEGWTGVWPPAAK
jgi:RHS repeat-associated protein